MAGFDEDDEFSDHNFAEFDEDELQHLEEDALRSTQQHPQKPHQSHTVPPLVYEPGEPDPRTRHVPTLKNTEQDEEYGDFENDYSNGTLLLDDDPTNVVEQHPPLQRSALSQQIAPETVQREKYRLQRYGQPRPPQPHQVQNHAGETVHRVQTHHTQTARNDLGQGTMDSSIAQHPSRDHDLVAAAETDGLRAQIEELLREKHELTSRLEDAGSNMQAQRGEISILRSNQAKEVKVLQREQAQLKKSMQDEADKHQASLKAIQQEKRQLNSEYNFQSNDLRKVNEEVAHLKRQLKDKSRIEHDFSTALTTKPLPQNSLRDGFDDTEMMVISPSRTSRSRTNTPRSKRKHHATVDVLVPPLALRRSDAPAKPVEAEPSDESRNGVARTVRIIKQDPTAKLNLEFVQKILTYRPSGIQANLMEVMMDYGLPSNTGKTFTSIVLEQVAHLTGPSLPTDLLTVFVQLLEDALKEKYYRCIPLVLQVLNFIVMLDSSVLNIATTTKVLPVLQSTAEINGNTRFRHSPMFRGSVGRPGLTPQSELVRDADGTACLKLMNAIACLVDDEGNLLEHFWRLMRVDFVLMMLNSSQPVSDIILMLQLLSTSILPSTFGNVFGTPDEQVRMEGYIIERVCFLLWENLRVDQGLTQYDESTVCELRLEAYSLLTNLAVTSSPHPHDRVGHHGSIILARHATAVARIVRSIHDELNALFLMSSAHSKHAQLVNKGVNLLYHIVSQHAENIDLQQKLTAVNGVVHKHKVALTRLAFSEGTYLDKEISSETVRLATMMLEDSVTPDEAEMLIECFPGFQGRSQPDG